MPRAKYKQQNCSFLFPTRSVQCEKCTPLLPRKKSCTVSAFPDASHGFSCACFCSIPHWGAGAVHREESTQWHRQHQPHCRGQREELLLKSAGFRFSSCPAAPSQHFISPGTAKGHRIPLAVLTQVLSSPDRGGEVSYPPEGSAPLLQEYCP